VGDRGREAGHPHEEAGPEGAGQLGYRPRERVPATVGLGADQYQDVLAGVVTAPAQLDPGPFECLVDAVDHDRHRPASPVVDELVGIEGGDQLGGDALQQRSHGPRAGQPGVDPSVGGEHQDGPIELRSLVDLVELRSWVHPIQGTFGTESTARPKD